MKTTVLTFIFVFFSLNIFSQKLFSISGRITNSHNEPISGAVVTIHEQNIVTVSDKNGFFEIKNLPPGQYHVHISFLGYKCVHYNIIEIVDSDIHRNFTMQPDNLPIDDIVVKAKKSEQIKKQNSQNIDIVDKEFIIKNLNTNFVKTLEKLPGIQSIDIGQGLSKPMIRGLSFNRVAVIDNGIKQEGQQWGADHGLEIDPFAVEKLEIIKGPSSLVYGSDAVAGVVSILPDFSVHKDTLISEFQTLYRSLNNQFSANIKTRINKNDFFATFVLSYSDYGDYRVPADSFFYNRYRLPIYNQTLKNTAGKENDFLLRIGLNKKLYKTYWTISEVTTTVGFFPGAHGLPDANKLVDDNNSRNIDLPFQKVNHLKIFNNTKFYFNNINLDVRIGFQNNLRQEWSLFHTHYQNQQPPQNNRDLELQFDLTTISADVIFSNSSQKNNSKLGFSAQHQQNKIDGYMFLLPNFDRTTAGVFVYNKYNKNKLTIDGGLRFDFGIINIQEFYSVYTNNYKSRNFSGKYYDLSGAVGLVYQLSRFITAKTTLGKSFRMPNAVELSANGVHHGSFRFEVGDYTIKSEQSYQWDIGLIYNSSKLLLEMNCFANYFPNFIYLLPTGSYLHPEGYEIAEADAGQVFRYTQSKAYRIGGELYSEWKMSNSLAYKATIDYVYATNFGFPIPFTPPLSFTQELNMLFADGKVFQNTYFSVEARIVAPQYRIAPNELKTNGYQIFALGFLTDIAVFKQIFNFVIQIQNLLDTKYYNHISFYRQIELPEPGRNIQIIVRMPLNFKL